jgi:hypothetical protein
MQAENHTPPPPITSWWSAPYPLSFLPFFSFILKVFFTLVYGPNGGRTNSERGDVKTSEQQTELLNSINSVHAIATW